MLQLYGERAELADGMDIALGCGWVHLADGYNLSQQPNYGGVNLRRSQFIEDRRQTRHRQRARHL